jgi:hypothetical protein
VPLSAGREPADAVEDNECGKGRRKRVTTGRDGITYLGGLFSRSAAFQGKKILGTNTDLFLDERGYTGPPASRWQS